LQAGHSVGITNARSVPSRSATTGPTISGMTSPALRSTTVSPISTPLRSTSHWLCRVAISTVEPATLTGSMTPNGVTRPVRPTLTRMSSSLVLTFFRRVLVRDRPPRRPAGRTEPPLQGQVVDLHDDAVDLVLDIVPMLAVIVDELLHASEVWDDLGTFGCGQAPGVQPLVPARLRCHVRPVLDLADAVHTIARCRAAVTRGSFWRSEPAAVLRGFANGALPASTSEALSFLEARHREEHLAADLEHLGHVVAGEAGRGRWRSSGCWG